MSACTVCGFPRWRSGDHADWCEDVTAYLASDESLRRWAFCAYTGCNLIVESTGDRCENHAVGVAA